MSFVDDTIHSVKAYRIERIKGGMKFNCTHCTHSVSTLDFDPKSGNLAPRRPPPSTITPPRRTTSRW